MPSNEISNVINNLLFIKGKLYNGIYGDISTPTIDNAIRLLKELEMYRNDFPTQISIDDLKL